MLKKIDLHLSELIAESHQVQEGDYTIGLIDIFGGVFFGEKQRKATFAVAASCFSREFVGKKAKGEPSEPLISPRTILQLLQFPRKIKKSSRLVNFVDGQG